MILKTSLEDALKTASQKKSKLLSKEYVNASKKLYWECEKGHRFWESLAHVKRGRWCRVCKVEKRNLGKLNELKDLVKLKYEGDCISDNFISTKKKLKWVCKNNHVWHDTPEHVKRGRWCSKCRKNLIP